MTNKEITERIQETFQPGDKVFFRDLISIKEWFTIESIGPLGEIILLPITAGSEFVRLKLSGLDALNFLSFKEYTLQADGISQERPKKNGDPFEVGDEVWLMHPSEGLCKGVITKKLKNEQKPNFALIYRAEKGTEHERFFTSGGKFFSWDILPSVFHQKPILSFE